MAQELQEVRQMLSDVNNDTMQSKADGHKAQGTGTPSSRRTAWSPEKQVSRKSSASVVTRSNENGGG